MIKSVITGGQTGGDIGAWDAAEACGITTSGWMPKDFQNRSGFHPEYESLYSAKQMQYGVAEKDWWYSARTRKNYIESDAAVLLVHDRRSATPFLIQRLAEEFGKPLAIFNPKTADPMKCAKSFISLGDRIGPYRLLVGSHSEPDYYDVVYSFLKLVFEGMKNAE